MTADPVRGVYRFNPETLALTWDDRDYRIELHYRADQPMFSGLVWHANPATHARRSLPEFRHAACLHRGARR